MSGQTLGSYQLGPNSTQENGIYTGDARELAKFIPDGSVDLIFTDPPYPAEFLYLYEWLSDNAARIIKPDGFLMMYVGPYHKDAVMSFFRGKMEYFWDYIDYNTQNSTIIWPRYTISRYKSILCYRQKGSSSRPRPNVLGVLPGNGADKQHHKWGQPESTSRYFISYFSSEGDTVLDPFVGAGTVCEACLHIQRKYLAFEIDPVTAKIARERVGTTMPMLFVPDVSQGEMF